MVLAIRIDETGGPDVLRPAEIDLVPPSEGEVRIRNEAIGLNFIDVYYRTGLYPMPLPGIIGLEGAGLVTAVGTGVTHVKEGDRVAYASAPLGAYCVERIMPANRVVKLPDFLTAQQAAALMVKGMTAEFLVRRTFPVKAGDRVLIHAAAGGVGILLTQWAKHLGATVIATAGSPEKCDIVRAHGADLAINYKEQNFTDVVKDFTNGQGVHVVYDGVGAATFMGSLDCLRPRGMMVSFGNASGPVPDFPPRLLSSKGSLFLTRPSLAHYTMTDQEYQDSAQAVFDGVQHGALRVNAPQTYPLREAAQAHRDLESRKTTGSVVLLPDAD